MSPIIRGLAVSGLFLAIAGNASAQCDPSVCAGIDILWNGAMIPRFDKLEPAKASCKADPVVWVTAKSAKSARKSYYEARSRHFGKGRPGVYVCRADARRAGLKSAR